MRTWTVDDYHEMREDYLGACIACGEYRECCEPDARAYECECCGEPTVYGPDELLLIGLIA